MRSKFSLFLAALLCLLLLLPTLASGTPTPSTVPVLAGSSTLMGPYGRFSAFDISMTVSGYEPHHPINVTISVVRAADAVPVLTKALLPIDGNGRHTVTLEAAELNGLQPGIYAVLASCPASTGGSPYTGCTATIGTVTVSPTYAYVTGEFVHTGDMGNMSSLSASYTLHDAVFSPDNPLNCFLNIAGVPSASITARVTGGDTVSFTIPSDILNKLGAGTYNLTFSCSGNSLTSSFSKEAGRIIVVTAESGASYVDPPKASVSNPVDDEEEEEEAEINKKIRLANGTTLGVEEIQELPKVHSMFQLEVPSSTTSSAATVPFALLQDLSLPLLVQTPYGAYVLSKSLTSHMPAVADNMYERRLRWVDMQADLYMAPATVDDLMKETLAKYGIQVNQNFYSMEYILTILGPGAMAVPSPNAFTAPVRRYITVPDEAVSNPNAWAAFLYQPETQSLRPVSQRVVELTPGQKTVAIDSYSNSIYLVTQRDVTLADVADDHPAYPYISRAVAKALMSTTADDKFQPDASITRAEFVQLFTNILYMPQATPHPYVDVLSSNAHDAAISEAKTAGWLELLAPGEEFLPDQAITREETVGILEAILEQHNVALVEVSSEELAKTYDDYLKVSPEYMVPLASIEKLDILPEVEDRNFSPKTKVTRAEAAEILIKTLVLVGYLDE